MELKSVGLLVVDGMVRFRSTIKGNLKAAQMDKLISEFKPVFERLGLKASVHLSTSGTLTYVLEHNRYRAEKIRDPYIIEIREMQDKLKEIMEKLDELEEEILRFEKLGRIINVIQS